MIQQACSLADEKRILQHSKDTANRLLRKWLKSDDSYNVHDMGPLILRGYQWN
jgi:hypothetical protein